MPRKKLKKSDYFVIAANLVPVYGVWFEGWSAKDVFIAYALETLIIGLFTIIKLLIATLYRKTDDWYNNSQTTKVSGLFFIFFFIMHYGLFVAVQMSLFAGTSNISPPGTGMMHFFFHWYEYIDRETTIVLCGFILSYAVRDLGPFVIKRMYREVPMMFIMFQPYGRIFIQQVIVIFGSLFLSLGIDKGFILVFAFVKIFFEVFLDFGGIINKAMKDMKEGSGKQ